MEIAKLILQFLDVLAWPTVLLIVLLIFRGHVDAVLARFSEGKEFEFEIGGQKLRINMLEKGIEQIVTSAQGVNPGEIESTKSIRDEIALLKELSSMSSLEIRLIAKFYGTDKLSKSELKSKYLEAQINLHRAGLIESADNGESIRLTQIGHKALEWITRSE